MKILELLEGFQPNTPVWVIQRSKLGKEQRTMATIVRDAPTGITVRLKDDPTGQLTIQKSQLGDGKSYGIEKR